MGRERGRDREVKERKKERSEYAELKYMEGREHCERSVDEEQLWHREGTLLSGPTAGF